MKVIHALAVSIFPACLAASIASAQTYPNRPITMVVAFPPGGADDATARILQDPMQKALGHDRGRKCRRRWWHDRRGQSRACGA